MDIIGTLENAWTWLAENWRIIAAVALPLYFFGSGFCLAGIFEKAGVKPAKALIPFRRVYLYWAIAWDGRRYLDILGFVAALAVFSVFITFLRDTGHYVLIAVYACLGVYLLYMRLRVSLFMAARFGRSALFGVVGLFLFKPVGMMILSLGSAEMKTQKEG